MFPAWPVLARTESLIEIARRRFPRVLDVSYEELCANPDGVFELVQVFLGVDPRRLTPGTIKVGRPLVESIRNFDEVCRWLAGTRYAAFLEMP